MDTNNTVPVVEEAVNVEGQVVETTEVPNVEGQEGQEEKNVESHGEHSEPEDIPASGME